MDGENDLMEEKHHIRVAMESKELQNISVDVDPIEHELDEDKLDETDLDDDGMGKQDDLDVVENDATSVVVSPPFEGQVFCTKDAAHTYYVQYAKQTGFSVRKRGDVKVEGIVRYTYFVCHRAERGSKKDALTPSERSKPVTSNVTGCMARMRLILREVGDYKVSQLILDHNHDVSPNKARLMAQHRYISRHDKMRLSYNDQGGIRRNLNFSVVAAEHGGYEQTTFTQKDANNFIDLDRKLRLGEGDAPALCKHFMEMQKRNSDFFYVINFDRENRIRNVFWADARSRAAYESFGDVVSFDTTYLTNKYEMPFAPFVGVNHHGQSILLGCALLCKEDEENFSWLFETWKECMGGVAPPCIITDQCGAMRLSIAKVFPNAKHRWCLWHIMKKIPKYFGQYSNYNSIKKRMQHVVYDSLREVDFDTEWKLMVEEYSLKDRSALKDRSG